MTVLGLKRKVCINASGCDFAEGARGNGVAVQWAARTFFQHNQLSHMNFMRVITLTNIRTRHHAVDSLASPPQKRTTKAKGAPCGSVVSARLCLSNCACAESAALRSQIFLFRQLRRSTDRRISLAETNTSLTRQPEDRDQAARKEKQEQSQLRSTANCHAELGSHADAHFFTARLAMHRLCSPSSKWHEGCTKLVSAQRGRRSKVEGRRPLLRRPSCSSRPRPLRITIWQLLLPFRLL